MKLTFCIALFLISIGCAHVLKAQFLWQKKSFFTYPTKIGLVLLINPIECVREVPIPVAKFPGLPLFSSLKVRKKVSGTKYDTALNVGEPFVNPSDTVRKFYLDLYTSNHKQVTVITQRIDSGVVEFKDGKEKGRNYFSYDLRHLQRELKVEQLLIVSHTIYNCR